MFSRKTYTELNMFKIYIYVLSHMIIICFLINNKNNSQNGLTWEHMNKSTNQGLLNTCFLLYFGKFRIWKIWWSWKMQHTKFKETAFKSIIHTSFQVNSSLSCHLPCSTLISLISFDYTVTCFYLILFICYTSFAAIKIQACIAVYLYKLGHSSEKNTVLICLLPEK